jgi:hypothetical protein
MPDPLTGCCACGTVRYALLGERSTPAGAIVEPAS